MTITPVSNTLYNLSIPGVSASGTYEALPDVVILNGESIFGIAYYTNYQGETQQPFTGFGIVLNSSDVLLGEAPATSINDSDSQAVPGGITSAHEFDAFGGTTYSNEFLSAWTNSSDGVSYSLEYTIFSQNDQGVLSATPAKTLFSDLTPVTVPDTVPWGNWTHIREASLSDGNVLFGIDSVNTQNFQQLNFAIIGGGGTVGANFTYSDPAWTAGSTYAWNLGAKAGGSSYTLFDSEISGQTALLHRSLITSSGAVTSSWTQPTSFSEIDQISWGSASTGNIVMDLSGVEGGVEEAHQLTIRSSSNGAVAATLDETYSGTLYQEARVVSLDSAGDDFLEYWVDNSGLTLEEVKNVNGQLQVAARWTVDPNANGSATVSPLGNGNVQVTWQVDNGDPSLAGSSSTDYTEIFTICFLAGTMIRTPDGATPIETLKPGDFVLTHEGAVKPVNWLGRQTISRRFSDPLRTLPIRIKAGALDENVPSRDLLVSPDHALLVGNVLIHAGALVNGTSITRETNVPDVFVYYHVELDDHSLILAENTPAETFVDTVDRLNFDNWAEFEALYPAGRVTEELPYPRAKAHRQVPARIRAALDRRARALAALPTLAA